MPRIDPTLNMINTMEDYEQELARINRDIQLLQQQMGVNPQTIAQRAQARADRQQLRARPRASWMNNPNG